MAKAVGYLRVSTGSQAESGLGLAAQRSAVEGAAKRLGLELVAVHADEGLSGSLGLEDRPALLAAVSALGRGDVLVVAKRDRLGRDVLVCAVLERLVAKRGAKIVSSAGEGSDDAGPSGELMRTLVDAFGQYERALIATRTKLALAAKRARNELAGSCPYGWRVTSDGRTLASVPAEQKVLGLVRELRGEGLSWRAVAEVLNARSLPAKKGGRWLHTSARSVLATATRHGR